MDQLTRGNFWTRSQWFAQWNPLGGEQKIRAEQLIRCNFMQEFISL